MKHPLISIIIPLHNKETYILETLDSLRAQTYPYWEGLVIENRSTDQGPDRVKTVQDPRIQLHITDCHGPCSARNHGLQLAQGKWILFLDADDLLPLDYLQCKIKAITDQPGRDLYTCPWEERDPHGKTEHHDPFGSRVSQQEMLASSFVYPPFAIHTTLIRREAITPELLWNEKLDQGLCEDAIFWFQLLHTASIAFHDDTRAIYRTETSGCRNEIQNTVKLFESYEKIIKSNLQFLERKKLRTNARHAYYLHTHYRKMERQATAENLPSLAQNARQNLLQIYPKMSLMDRLKFKLSRLQRLSF